MTYGCSGGGRLRLGEAGEAAERHRQQRCLGDIRVKFVSIGTENRTIVQHVLPKFQRTRFLFAEQILHPHNIWPFDNLASLCTYLPVVIYAFFGGKKTSNFFFRRNITLHT